MIEFNGIKIDTRSLVLIAATIVAVVALWPEGTPERDHPGKTAGTPHQDTSSNRNEPVKQGLTTQRNPQPLQGRFDPTGAPPYAANPYYPGAGATPPAAPYPQQGPYGGYHYRQPQTNTAPDSRAPYGYGDQGPAPHGYTTPYPGMQFRPEEKRRPPTSQYSRDDAPSSQPYAPRPPGTVPPAYSPGQQAPWDYVPYDVAPSGSATDMNHLYSVR